MSGANSSANIAAPIDLEKEVGEFERALIERALEACDGVQTRAATHLGTTRRILRYRMDKLGINPQRGKHP